MNRITRLVALREIKEAVRKKAFWISAGAMLLGSLALVIIPELVGDDNESATLATTAAVPKQVTDQVTAIAESVDLFITVESLPTRALAQQAVVDGDVDYALVVDDEDGFTILQRTDGANVVVPIVQEVLRQQATARIYADAGVQESVISDVSNLPPTPVEVVDTERGGRQGAAFGLTIVMYLMIMMLSNIIASAVATEKANRVSEVLLAVAAPRSLLAGKVIGIAALGLATIVVAALPLIGRSLLGGDMPDGIGVTLASSGVWFLGGITMYLLVSAVLGALADRTEEAGGAIAPLTLVLVAVYLLSLSTLETTVGAVLSVVPVSSPIVMPARIAIGAASTAEIVASLLALALGVIITARLATVVYARALVRTGKRLRLIDVLRNPR